MDQYWKCISDNWSLFYQPSGIFLNMIEDNNDQIYWNRAMVPFDFHHLFPCYWSTYYSKSNFYKDVRIPYLSLVITKVPLDDNNQYIPIVTELSKPMVPSFAMLNNQINCKCLFIEAAIPRKDLRSYSTLRSQDLYDIIIKDVRFILTIIYRATSLNKIMHIKTSKCVYLLYLNSGILLIVI